MITDLLLNVLFFFVSVVVSPITNLPDATLDPNVMSALGNVQGMIATLNPVFPIATIFGAVAILVGVEFALFGYKVIMWIIRKIPTIS